MRHLLVSLVLLLTIGSFFPLSQPVRANPGPPVDDATNLWTPYGPSTPNLLLSYYSSDAAEFNDFLVGHLDITDWPSPTSTYSTYDNNPDFTLSTGQGQFGMFGLDFNYGASTWSAWGCDWQHGNSPCGIEIREAFAHLVDRPRYVTDGPLLGSGQSIADPSPPAKDPSGSSLPTQCSWETISTYQNCADAFDVAPDSGGFAQPGSPDFCAAVDHLVRATSLAPTFGINRNPNNSCAIDPNSPGLANILSHPIRFMVRNDDPLRLALGQGFTLAVDQLFGASIVSPLYASIATLRPIVFTSAPNGLTDDWDMYTFGWSLTGPFPDHLLALYTSAQASDQCGGQNDPQTLNYGFICLSTFDTYVQAGSQTASTSVFKADTLSAFNEFGKHVANIPVYARGIRIAALRSVNGLVNSRGVSYPNTWTMLYAHNNTAYTPANSLYKFGGGLNEIRWGQKQGTNELNVFNALTLWEFNPIGEVYDTLFASSPIEPANILCWMCQSYSTVVDASGNTHFQVQLRRTLKWQDGVPVNASDIKFSLLNYRDVPAANLVGNVQLLSSVTILGPYFVDIKMQGQSISHLVNLAAVPIIPRHLWECPANGQSAIPGFGSCDPHKYSDVGQADPGKSDPSYDPISAGTFIGSGPFMCRSVFSADLGRVGTGCVRNSDGTRGGQSIGPGGTMLLQAFDRTADPGNNDPFLQFGRSYNPAWGTGSGAHAESGQFQEFSWADRYDNGTVTILDVYSVASCFGKTSPSGCADYSYWLRPAFHPGTPTSIGSELTIVASHIGDTWVSPFSWTGTSQQPGIGTLENIAPFTP